MEREQSFVRVLDLELNLLAFAQVREPGVPQAFLMKKRFVTARGQDGPVFFLMEQLDDISL